MIKVAINGFGRIGRQAFKVWLDKHKDALQIVAINDLVDAETLAYLLKFDSVYGTWDRDIQGIKVIEDIKGTEVIEGKEVGQIKVDDQSIKVFATRDPAKLPWKDLGVDVVVESTGLFVNYEKAKVHLDAGAKKVVISAPVKDSAEALLPPVGGSKASATSATLGETILMGVNEEKFGTCDITSNASCTTNAASPLIAILDEALGIDKALLNTVHGYTASQSIVDGPNKKDFREGRAAAQNIVPSSTGAAIAVTKAFTKLSGLFDGISMRVPVPCAVSVWP